jgi:hypothetical protein
MFVTPTRVPGASSAFARLILSAFAVSSMAAAQVSSGSSSLHSGFVENAGQWDVDSRFVAVSGADLVRLDAHGLVLQRRVVSADGRPVTVALRLGIRLGSAPVSLTWSGSDPLPGRCNYLIGDDPGRWRSGLERFASARAPAHAMSLQVIAPQQADDVLRLRLSLSPASLASPIELDWIGADAVVVDTRDRAAVRAGEFTLHPSASWRPAGVPESASRDLMWEQGPPGRVRLAIPPVDAPQGADVDLTLSWATFLGGEEGGEYIHDLALDSLGRPVAVGETRSPDFPTTLGVVDSTWGGGSGAFETDAFVSCLAADGSGLVFSTFLGGAGNDLARAVTSRLVVAGQTASADFPSTPGAFDTQHDVGEGFVARLAPDGSSFEFATFVGGVVRDADDLPSGATLAGGVTFDTSMPVTPDAIFPTAVADVAVAGTGFVVVLDESGSKLEFASYVSGLASDIVHGVAASPTVAAPFALCGGTQSSAFPTTPGALPVPALSRGFLALMGPASGLLYSATIGARAHAVRLNEDRYVTVGGYLPAVLAASGGGIPTTASAFDPTLTISDEAFVLRVDALTGEQHFGTYLGSLGQEVLWKLETDSALRTTVAGFTTSDDFPTTPGAFDTLKAGSGVGQDSFILRLAPAGDELLYSSFLGGQGSEGDFATGLAVDAAGGAVIGAATGSADFPVTPGSYDDTPPLVFDAYVARLDLHPLGVEAFGATTAGALGPLAAGVTAQPVLGATDFALTCTGAPPRTTAGVLLLALAPASRPLGVKGIDLWVDPGALLLLLPAASDDHGYAVVPLRIPADTAAQGLMAFVQFAWKSGASWSSSNGLAVTLQAP